MKSVKLIESATEKCYPYLYEEQNNKLVLFHRIMRKMQGNQGRYRIGVTELGTVVDAGIMREIWIAGCGSKFYVRLPGTELDGKRAALYITELLRGGKWISLSVIFTP